MIFEMSEGKQEQQGTDDGCCDVVRSLYRAIYVTLYVKHWEWFLVIRLYYHASFAVRYFCGPLTPSLSP